MTTYVNMQAPNGVTAAGVAFWPDGSTSTVATNGVVQVPQIWLAAALDAGFQLIPAGDGAVITTAPSNPATTVSLTPVMAGLGVQITPKASSRVSISIMGQMAQSTSGDGSQVDCRYGTGTPPVNGAAASGTVVGQAQKFTAVAANHGGGFSLGGIVTGLTPGTTYWFDLSQESVTGGTTSLTGLTVEAFEM